MFISFLIDVIGINLSMLVSFTVRTFALWFFSISHEDPLLPDTPGLPSSPSMSLSMAAGPSRSSCSARIPLLHVSPPVTHWKCPGSCQSLPGLFCQTRTPGTTTHGLPVPSANEFALSPSHARKVPLVSLVSDPSGLSGLICFSALPGPY